jgi:hypothetical protein
MRRSFWRDLISFWGRGGTGRSLPPLGSTSEFESFGLAEAAAIEQSDDQAVGAGEMGEDGAHFCRGEDGREMVGALGSDGVDAAVKILLEHVLIQKEQGTQGLVLGGDVFDDRKVAEESLNIGNTHILGVTLVMKQNVTFDPLNIGFFCTMSVVFEPN